MMTAPVFCLPKLALKETTVRYQKITVSFLYILLFLILVTSIWGRAQAGRQAITLKCGRICVQNLTVVMLKLKIETAD